MSNIKSQRERLYEWVQGLTREQLMDTLVECTEELILSETVSFWDTTQKPYWDTTGENIDGTERRYDDED